MVLLLRDPYSNFHYDLMRNLDFAHYSSPATNDFSAKGNDNQTNDDRFNR